MTSKKINYEEFILQIFFNATQKTLSSITLYKTGYSYNESFFFSVIAQEELSKLIILPIANELNQLEEVLKNRNNAFYSHPIKQKIFTSFGLQNRTHNDIEKIKQGSLYVGVDESGSPTASVIKPELVLEEITHLCLFLVNNYQNLRSQNSFSKTTQKGFEFFMRIVYECIAEELPEVNDMIEVQSKNIDKMSSEEISNLKTERLIMNPYNLIGMFKAVFKDSYKEHLKNIQNFSFDELTEYLDRIDVSDL